MGAVSNFFQAVADCETVEIGYDHTVAVIEDSTDDDRCGEAGDECAVALSDPVERDPPGSRVGVGSDGKYGTTLDPVVSSAAVEGVDGRGCQRCEPTSAAANTSPHTGQGGLRWGKCPPRRVNSRLDLVRDVPNSVSCTMGRNGCRIRASAAAISSDRCRQSSKAYDSTRESNGPTPRPPVCLRADRSRA